MKDNEILNLGVASTALTLDVITEYCFGESWECLSKPDFAPEWKRTMTGLFEPVPIVKQFPRINQILTSLPESFVAKMNPDLGLFLGAQKAARQQVVRIMEERSQDISRGEKNAAAVTNNGADPKPSKTIFHDILDSSLPAAEKSVDRLAQEGFVMVVAGGETTAKALSNLIYRLLANTEWLNKVREELDDLMPSPKNLASLSTLEALPNLASSIKEALRISSLVTNRIGLIEPVETLTYGKWAIPPGIPVSMSLTSLHEDSDAFSEPNKFNPGRWIRAKEAGWNLDKYYAPFSKGSRSCLGINLAYSEIFLASAALLRRFEFELYDVNKERDVDVVRDCFVGMPSKASKGIRVRVLKERA